MTPLVFVHGFMGGSGQWQLQDPLEDGRKLIRLDLPGFGLNAHLAPINSIEGFARWVLRTLSEKGVDQFDLLGHSMGGMIVQEVTRIAPTRVCKLILYGTGAVGVLPGRFESIETSIERAITDGPHATARRISATWFREGDAATEYAGCAAIAEQSTLPAILAGLEAMRGWSGVGSLAQIAAPTLIVWGDGDRTYKWAQTEQLWSSVGDSNLAVIPKCAHAVHLENASVFNGTVAHFLEA